MTNQLYNPYAESLLDGSAPDLTDVDIKAALVDLDTYTFNADHEFFSSVSGAVVGTPVSLGNKSKTNGVFDADDVTVEAVESQDDIEAVVLYVDDGVDPSSSPLICFLDEGISAEPNGDDIIIRWSSDGILEF